MVETLVERCLCIALSLMDRLLNPRFGERIYGFTVSTAIAASTVIQAPAHIVTYVDPPSAVYQPPPTATSNWIESW